MSSGPALKIRRIPIGFDDTQISPGATEKVTVVPQTVYRVRHIRPARLYPTLVLLNLEVGYNSQLVTASSIPFATFQSDPKLGLILDVLNNASVKGVDAEALVEVKKLLTESEDCFMASTAQIGQKITLTIRNDGPETVLLQGVLLGDSAEFVDSPTLSMV